MNKYKEDELDAFLWEVETVSKQVKDILEGNADVDKLLEKERISKEKSEKEEKLRKMREEEKIRKLEEKLTNGNKGKGAKDNYLKFCRSCFTEYEIDTISKCTHCNSNLITRQQRHTELKEKLEQLKDKKAKKLIRKQKYENWLKTESILKTTKVNFQNYHKWDLYESSTDEDEKGEPILPRHDPNFLAMEKELIETEKKREISRNKSIKLKEEGNKMMKDGKFKKAVKLYSEAIEETKSMMILYTNRALAYFKLEDYQASIADCDKVIEYLEIFEDQLQKNVETYVKAISRKALCCQKLKNYVEAKTLVAKCLEYVKDEEILKLQKNITIEEEIQVKALNQISGDSKAFEEITKFLEFLQKCFEGNESQSSSYLDDNTSNSQNNLHSLIPKIKSLLEKDENNRLYFIQKGGLELIFTKSILNTNISVIELIEVFHRDRDNRYILLINNLKGYNKLISILFNKETMEKTENNRNIESNNSNRLIHIKSLVSILEDASHNEEVRKTLSDLKEIDKLFQAAMTQYDISDKTLLQNESVVIIIMHLFTFIGNLCYSANEIRQRICKTQSETILNKLYKFLENFDVNDILYKNVMETVLSFLINLSCDDKFRENLGGESKLIKFLVNGVLNEIKKILNNQSKSDLINSFKKNFDDLYEKVCCLIYNLTISNNQVTSNKLVESYIEYGIVDFLQNYLEIILPCSSNISCNNQNYSELDFKSSCASETSLLRTLMLTTKITKNYSHLFEEKFYNSIIQITKLKILKIDTRFVDNEIKILAHFLQSLNNSNRQNKNEILSKLQLRLLITNLKEVFVFDYPNIDSTAKERIINNMSLMISLISIQASLAENLREIVKYLIEIAKEKMDLLRKNSAILLAKITKSSSVMESYVRELHGMDVLMNVAKFIQLNK